MVHWFSYLTLFSFQYIVTNAIWNNESYTRLFTDSSKLSSASIESEDYTVGDTYDGDLLHHIHNKAIQRLLNRKGIMKKFPTPTLEEIQKNKESQKHSSFRKQVSYKATGYLDNQIFTTKSCSGFVESSIIFGVGFCVPTSGGGYLLDATKSFKKITIIINEYIDQKCQYLSQQFLTTQSSYCQVINNAFETFTYYATSSVPLQPVDGPEFK